MKASIAAGAFAGLMHAKPFMVTGMSVTILAMQDLNLWRRAATLAALSGFNERSRLCLMEVRSLALATLAQQLN